MNAWEDPDALLRRLKLGREEYCQRLLTTLILGTYPRWNTRSEPTAQGLDFLRALDEVSFGEISALGPDAVFIDELDLPARTQDETGRAPDYAVVTSQRIWVIELKTERGSHQADQLPAYVELASHHFPGLIVDVTYLTPPMPGVRVHQSEIARVAHVTWDQVLPLVDQHWVGRGEQAARTSEALAAALDSIGQPWSAWREQRISDVVAKAVEIARETAHDGKQRALDHLAGSLEELQGLRLDVRDRLRRGDEPGDDTVTPWLWNSQSSGGRPLTAAGGEIGYELRFSRSRLGFSTGNSQAQTS